MEQEIKKLGGKNVSFITNGYDKADFENLNVIPDKEFSIVHIGTIHKERNPNNLWKVLKEMVNEIPGFKNNLKIRLIGKVDFSIIEEIVRNQ